ncbi:DNA (cytosine-5)-methyltransferase 3A, partial [Frankliniella fusca]
PTMACGSPSGMLRSSDEVHKSDAQRVSSEEPPFLGFDVPPSTKCLRVLSLFNGISTGLVALDSLGVNVGAYYSSEIDPDALAISRKRFHGRIIEIGCVTSSKGSSGRLFFNFIKVLRYLKTREKETQNYFCGK